MSNTVWDFPKVECFLHKVYGSQFCNKNKSAITNLSMFVQK